jgi:hypothetical protein
MGRQVWDVEKGNGPWRRKGPQVGLDSLPFSISKTNQIQTI